MTDRGAAGGGYRTMNDGDRIGSMRTRGPSVYAKKGFMADFFKDVDVIKADISFLTKATHQIQELVEGVTHSMDKDAIPKATAEIEGFKQEANRRALNTKNLLQKIKQENRRLENDDGAAAGSKVGEHKIRVNMHSTLVRKYVDVMKEYQAAQIEFKSTVQSTVVRRIKYVSPEATNQEIEETLRKGDGGAELFRRAILQQGTNSKVQGALRDAVDSYNDVLKLEENVKALQEMFLDMAYLVEQQGELLGQIEFQVNSAADYVESGAVELGKAVKERKKLRKKMCLLAICILILLIIIVVPIAASISG